MPALDTKLAPALAVACAKGVSPDLWASVLEPFMWQYGINTARRIAAFVGQVGVESAGFTALEEDLYYSADRLCVVWPSRFAPGSLEATACARQPEKLANIVYANRMGNGNEASGDGYRFRGAGLIQLTGRENQTAFAQKTKVLPENVGDYLRTPKGAAESACWFWSDRSLNTQADGWCLTFISLAINGGGEGRQQRIDLCNKVRLAIGA